MGDIHFSQGDGEISFCGAIEMSGFIDLHVDIIKGGMAKYGMVNPIFKPGPVEPHHSRVPRSSRASRSMRQGKQYYLDAHVAYKRACLNCHRVPEEVRLHGRAGLPAAELRPGRGADQRHRGHSQRLLHAGAADVDLREEHPAGLRVEHQCLSTSSSAPACGGFEASRPIQQASAPLRCPSCRRRAPRILSAVAIGRGARPPAGAEPRRVVRRANQEPDSGAAATGHTRPSLDDGTLTARMVRRLLRLRARFSRTLPLANSMSAQDLLKAMSRRCISS